MQFRFVNHSRKLYINSQEPSKTISCNFHWSESDLVISAQKYPWPFSVIFLLVITENQSNFWIKFCFLIWKGKVLPILAAQLNSHWIISLCLCKFPLQLKRHWVFFFHWLQLSSLTQLHFDGSEVIPLYHSYFAKNIWCEVDEKESIAGSHSRASSITPRASQSSIFLSPHPSPTPPRRDVQWQEHSQCPSSIPSSALFQLQLSRTHFQKQEKPGYGGNISAFPSSLMWHYKQPR